MFPIKKIRYCLAKALLPRGNLTLLTSPWAICKSPISYWEWRGSQETLLIKFLSTLPNPTSSLILTILLKRDAVNRWNSAAEAPKQDIHIFWTIPLKTTKLKKLMIAIIHTRSSNTRACNHFRGLKRRIYQLLETKEAFQSSLSTFKW